MPSTLEDIRGKLNRYKGQRDQLRKQLDFIRSEQIREKRRLHQHEEALEIVRSIAIQTQQQLSYHISDIASLALNGIFPDPYYLQVEFVQRRNKTECDLYFVRNEEKIDPLTASGGGAVDVASFALRIASWSMQSPRTRNVIILDEPFKHLSEDLLPLAGEVLREISDKLHLQFIIITHSEELMDCADRVFKVSMKGGKSNVITQAS